MSIFRFELIAYWGTIVLDDFFPSHLIPIPFVLQTISQGYVFDLKVISPKRTFNFDYKLQYWHSHLEIKKED